MKMSGICERLLWIQWIGIGRAVGGGKMEKKETKKGKEKCPLGKWLEKKQEKCWEETKKRCEEESVWERKKGEVEEETLEEKKEEVEEETLEENKEKVEK